MSNNLTHKGLVAIALALYAGGAFAATTTYWVQRYDYLVRVNGQAIRSNEYILAKERATAMLSRQMGLDPNSDQGKSMLAMVEKSALDNLIDQQLIVQAARAQGLSASNTEIDTEFNQLLGANYQNNREALERDLRANRMSIGQFRAELEVRILTRKLREALTRTVKVKPEAEAAYYQANRTRFEHPEQVEASHILFKGDKDKPALDEKARRKAETVLAELKAGKPFAEMARKHSEDESTRTKGGELGAFKKGDMVTEFENAIWPLKPGELAPKPVKTDFGYHLMLRGKTIPAGIKPLAEARKEFAEELLEQERSKHFQTWLETTRKAAKIERREPVPSASPAASNSPSAIPSPSASS
jgi:parvulin-like peptidyl-prolyl isomerase